MGNDKGGVYRNLFDVHPPFQIDGNFGAVAGMCEMLLQSHEGLLHLLPALPTAWPKGSISGLKVSGAFSVNMAWKDGRLTLCTITSEAGKPCILRLPTDTKWRKVIDRQGKKVKVKHNGSMISFDTQQDERYTIII